jgi:hypothetical protein
MEKCYECEKGTLLTKNVKYEQYGIPIGKYPAEVCTKCAEVFFSSGVVGKIEDALKKKGLWGLGAKTQIGTSGNSLDLKLAKKLIHFFHLKKGQSVFIEPRTTNSFEVYILGSERKLQL